MIPTDSFIRTLISSLSRESSVLYYRNIEIDPTSEELATNEKKISELEDQLKALTEEAKEKEEDN